MHSTEQLRQECVEWRLRSRMRGAGGTDGDNASGSLSWIQSLTHLHLGRFTLLKTFLEAPSNFYVAWCVVFFCKIILDLTKTLGLGI